jgi:hypothetical protein
MEKNQLHYPGVVGTHKHHIPSTTQLFRCNRNPQTSRLTNNQMKKIQCEQK